MVRRVGARHKSILRRGRPAKDRAELFVLAVVRRHAIADEVESRAELDDSIEFYKGSLASLKDVTLTKGVKARFEVALEISRLTRRAEHYGASNCFG